MSYLKGLTTLLPTYENCNTDLAVQELINSFQIPEGILATQKDIKKVWNSLGDTLEEIKVEYRHELLFRMVIAIRVGLFGSAVNEMWNTSMLALRQKVYNFGYNEAASFLERNINQTIISDMTDAELINVCSKLGFIDDDAFFALDYCRQIRNNYSSAHPSESMLDGVELEYFIHQCIKHILGNSTQFIGFPVSEFMTALKTTNFTPQLLDLYTEKIKSANAHQKSAILKMIFSNYVDEHSEEFIRSNCLKISQKTWEEYDDNAINELLNLYSKYLIQDKNTKVGYAERYFEKLGSLEMLPKERAARIILRAINDLEQAHNSFNNFYEEEAFAERMYESFNNQIIPATILKKYVYVIAQCYIGNAYGTSNAAKPYYEKLIKNFSLKETNVFFEILQEENFLVKAIKHHTRCKSQLKALFLLLEEETIPVKFKKFYQEVLNTKY